MDDEHDLMELFCDALKYHGFEAIGFDDPLKAVSYLYSHHQEFLLILTDVRMPAIDGFQLAKLVNPMDKEIKIISMSAFEMYDNKLKKVRMDEFVRKPIHIDEFVNIIRKHLMPIHIHTET
ncbi:MAG TPA: response regulator [Nitrososphaeraceae archaeon]